MRPRRDLILVVEATTGAILDSTTVQEGERNYPVWAAIAPDPLTDVLYVADASADWAPWTPTLWVYRRSTLELLAVLRVPEAGYIGGGGGEVGVIPAPLDGVVYMLFIGRYYDPPSGHVAVYRFDRMP
jgi:hypothetical protein